MHRLTTAFLLAFTLTLAACDSGGSDPVKEEDVPLRTLARERGIEIGAAVNMDALAGEPQYQQVLAREFGMVTAENVTKFGPIHPVRSSYNWAAADAFVSFAERNNMKVRGHTLVWHQQNAAWVTERAWTREALIEVMQEQIASVVGRYKGRVAAWDVVNEAISDGGSDPLRTSVWRTGIGDDYIDIAFRAARAADPSAKLFYNDYSAEGLGTKSDRVYNLVNGLRQRGVPIDGVGMQMHLSARSPLSTSDLKANMKRLADLGLEVQITELDVRIPLLPDGSGPDSGDLMLQGEVYDGTMRVCLEADNCTAFVLWGFTDKYSWVPGQFSGWGAALIFDALYQPKLAYTRLAERLQMPH